MDVLVGFPSWHTLLLRSDLSATTVRVGLIMQGWTSEMNPSISRLNQQAIADDAHVTLRTVRRSIRELVEAGFIQSIRRGVKKTNIYILVWPPGEPEAEMSRRLKHVGLTLSDEPSSEPSSDRTQLSLETTHEPSSDRTLVASEEHLVTEVEEEDLRNQRFLRSSSSLAAKNRAARTVVDAKSASERAKYTAQHRAIFGALCDMMGRPPSGGEGGVWGRVAKLMAQEGIPPVEIPIRARRMAEKWPSIPPSPMALWNNWGQFAEAAPVESAWQKQQRFDRELHADLVAQGVIDA